jgi:molybdate transport system substrate-binding protein
MVVRGRAGRGRAGRALAGLAAAALLTGCSSGQGAEADRELVVSAAASLTDAFGELAAAFEAANPGTDVVLNLGGTSRLREQVLAGAPVDVFASAGTADVDRLVEAGLVAGEQRVVAENHLVVAFPADGSAEVTGIVDLADPDRFVGLCAPEVPCGAHARRLLDAAGVSAVADTQEPDVRALVTKLVAGELDVGVVYASDVVATGDALAAVPFPPEVDEPLAYPVAVLAGEDTETAEAFVAFVASDEGRAVLDRWGFETP